MFHAPHRAAALACALLASTALAAPAFAQSSGAPSYRNLDANGVDLTHGGFYLDFLEGSIGSGEAELQLRRRNAGRNQWDAIELERSTSGSAVTVWVTLGAESEKFTGTAGNLTSTKKNGGILLGGGGGYTYQARDGTTISFEDPTNHQMGGWTNLCNGEPQNTCRLMPSAITSPDGKSVNFEWNLAQFCANDGNWGALDCQYFWRLQRVTNSYQQQIAFSYASDIPYATDYGGGTLGESPRADWSKRTRSDFVNTLASASPQASVTYAYPAAGVTDVTDMGGRTWRFTSISGGATTGIRRPGAATDTTTISYGPGTIALSRDGVATNYSRTVSGSTATTTVTNALNEVTTIVSDLTIGRPTSVTNNALSRTTSYQYDSSGRLTRVTQPEGNYVQLTLDARGNVTQQQAVAKGGSATITQSATYAADCQANPSCNEPLTTTDPLGNVTNYAYDSTHGGLLSVTAPAPTPGAARPETRYSYAVSTGEHRPTGVSTCQTQASCAGTADEVRTTIEYGLNGLPTSKTVAAGDGSLSTRTDLTFDDVGNLHLADGPLAGMADWRITRHNAARQPLGTVMPDPDGGGPLKNRAVRNIYDARGLLTRVERGTVGYYWDAHWAAFAPIDHVEIGYDNYARPVRQDFVGGGAVQRVVQTSYDTLGRVECVAERMNPAVFSALPVSACVQGTTGSFGPDRISKRVYNAAGEVTHVRTAVGTALEAAEVTTSYTANGRVQSVTDAEGNKTSYEYDGFDRLAKTVYPSATAQANASNPSDYEQLTYDAGGNVLSRRLRDGASISYSYDALGRMVGKNLPNAAQWEFDSTYGYDNLGRLVSAVNTNTHAVRFSYDALGRKLSEASDHYGAKTFQYDVAGRRTRMTWRDGFFVTYDYLATGEVATIRENGAASGPGVLASFAYDDLGRRTQLTRGNGTVTSYGYDAGSRLASLAQDLGGVAYDATATFAYNPASQIASSTRSNDAYAWNSHFNVSRNYAANGLNQYTQSGSITPTYDAKGNLTSAGATSYNYTAENQLAVYSGVNVGGLAYDPLGRLYYIGNADSWLDYNGGDLATEIKAASNSILRRYVHGPGTDEPLVWYEGSGTNDRRYLHADERGSIVAVSDSAGGVIGVNRYDEYGIPAASNSGRFQYTGQTWLAELGMYYYKARIYSPTLGRFLQTDPIGYGDGMNMYTYVGGDPVNKIDPTGLEECPVQPCDGQLFVTSFRWINMAALLHAGDPGMGVTQNFFSAASEGGGAQDPCSRPLSGSAHRGQSVNSRRAQVRREIKQAAQAASRGGGDPADAISVEVGRNMRRLTPNVGSWIVGGTSNEDGNLLYGAIMDELGYPLWVSQGSGHAFELIDDIVDRVLPWGEPDERFGLDDAESQEDIAEGAKCPG